MTKRMFKVTVKEVRERIYEVEVDDYTPDPGRDAERAARFRVLSNLATMHAVEDRHVSIHHPIETTIEEVKRA